MGTSLRWGFKVGYSEIKNLVFDSDYLKKVVFYLKSECIILYFFFWIFVINLVEEFVFKSNYN